MTLWSQRGAELVDGIKETTTITQRTFPKPPMWPQFGRNFHIIQVMWGRFSRCFENGLYNLCVCKSSVKFMMKVIRRRKGRGLLKFTSFRISFGQNFVRIELIEEDYFQKCREILRVRAIVPLGEGRFSQEQSGVMAIHVLLVERYC